VPTNQSTKVRQSESQLEATNHNEPWTDGEVQLLLECKDEVPLFEIAGALGRTYYAVMDKLTDLAKGRGNAAHGRTNRPVLAYDRGWTTIPDSW